MRKLFKGCMYIFGGVVLLILVIAIAGMFIDTDNSDKDVSITDKKAINEAATEEAKDKEATTDPDSVVKEEAAKKDALNNLDFMLDKMITDSKGTFARAEYEQIKDHFEADLYINDTYWLLTPEDEKPGRAEKMGEIIESKFIGSGLVKDGDGVHVTIKDVKGDNLAVEDFTGGSYEIKK